MSASRKMDKKISECTLKELGKGVRKSSRKRFCRTEYIGGISVCLVCFPNFAHSLSIDNIEKFIELQSFI